MKKVILFVFVILCFVSPVLAADVTVAGLTDAQATALVGQNLTKYLSSLADYLIAEKAADEKYQLIKVLIAKTPAELKAAAAPIIAAEKVKVEAEVQPK
jgi:hypothetical protein